MAGVFNSVLIASFWGGSLTVLFLLVNKLFKNKLPVTWHYYIWLVVLVRLLVPVSLPVSIEPKDLASIVQDKNVSQREATINTIPTVGNSEKMTATQTDSIQAGQQIIVRSTKDATVNIVSQVFRVNNFWIIWLVIATMLAAHKLISYFLYVQKLKDGCIRPNKDEMQIFVKQKETLTIRSSVAFLKYKGAQTPFAMGLFTLTVILPDKEYSETQLNYIFHHELTHINRYDIGIKWVFEMAKAIHWFNPLVYMASQNAAFYCEASCDAIVLKNKAISERKEYSMIILDLISQAVNSKMPMCVSMYNSKNNLKKRIQYILDSGQGKKSIGLAATIAVLTFTLCACSSIQLQEAPRAERDPVATVETTINTKAETTIDTSEVLPSFTKAKTNILLAGVDDTGEVSRADTIMIASFDSVANQISLMSIPRDTYLLPSEETVTALKQQSIDIPSEIKLGQVIAYAHTNGMEYLQKEISNTLGIPIDYYIRMDISAFQKIVDAAGGVTMTIPEGGLYYSDPSQQLDIALDEGLQHLDGEKAMMLVRYRSTYRNGDLDRIDVQQQFLQELYTQAMTCDNLIEELTTLVSILTENTETNLTLRDFTSYVPYIPKINADSLQILQLPIGIELINTHSYAVIDNDEFEKSIADIFR